MTQKLVFLQIYNYLMHVVFRLRWVRLYVPSFEFSRIVYRSRYVVCAPTKYDTLWGLCFK